MEAKYTGKRTFPTFIMPMIMLAIRMEIEVIFKNSYPEFFSKVNHEKVSQFVVIMGIDSYETGE